MLPQFDFDWSPSQFGTDARVKESGPTQADGLGLLGLEALILNCPKTKASAARPTTDEDDQFTLHLPPTGKGIDHQRIEMRAHWFVGAARLAVQGFF